MKTFNTFINEAAKVIGKVNLPKQRAVSFGPRKSKPKRTPVDSGDISRGIKEIGAIFSKYGAKLDKTSFKGHMADRLADRSHTVDEIIRLFKNLATETSFYKSLGTISSTYERDKGRKYGPQLLDPVNKVHVGVEVTKDGGKYNIVTKSIMGDYSKSYISKTKNHPSKPKFFYI